MKECIIVRVYSDKCHSRPTMASATVAKQWQVCIKLPYSAMAATPTNIK